MFAATLTINGPLDQLEAALRLLQENEPALQALVEPIESIESATGWTAVGANSLVARLAWRQRRLLEMLVEGRGSADSETLRAELANEKGQLKALTGPISKHVKTLISNGTLPEGTSAPTRTQYDPEIAAYQRTLGIEFVQDELVELFATALARTS